jgi:hypothetical protein
LAKCQWGSHIDISVAFVQKASELLGVLVGNLRSAEGGNFSFN